MSNQSKVQITYKKIKWTPLKLILTALLIISGITCIILGIYPLIDMDYDIKSFCNLVFVVFHCYYIFSLSGVKKNSDFVFWVFSYLLLCVCSLMFYFYDDIFI